MTDKIKNLEKIESKLQKSYDDLKLLKSLDKFVSKKKNIDNESYIYNSLTNDLKDIKNLIRDIKRSKSF